jgi:hypothetical protein
MKVWLLESGNSEYVGMVTTTQRLFYTKEKAIEAFKNHLNYPFTIELFKKDREKWTEEMAEILQKKGKVIPCDEYDCNDGYYPYSDDEEYGFEEERLWDIDDKIYTLKAIEIE